MATLPPTLAEIGHALWGPNWARPLAATLNLATEEVISRDAHTDEIPREMTDQIIVTCRLRIQEIGALLERLKTGSLSPCE